MATPTLEGHQTHWLTRCAVESSKRRMAELHAKGGAGPVWEGGPTARCSTAPTIRISQRNFGGHTHPRLAHVGDRTGLS